MGQLGCKIHKPSTEISFLLALAATIKARWVCEQAHQQLKEELGRSLREDRLRFPSRRAAKRRRINGRRPQPTFPAVPHPIRELDRRNAMSALQKMD